MGAGVHVTPAVLQEARGAVAAQRAVERIAAEQAPADYAWLRFVELASLTGWRSPACRAFVCELAKRAGGPSA